MLIDLQTVIQETEVRETLPQDWWKAADRAQQILGFSRPFEAHIKISRVGDKFLVDGKLYGGLEVVCDRCLEPFDLEVKAEFNVYLVARERDDNEENLELLDEEMEVDFIQGETVDLDDVIREQIYLSVPMKCVCQESCRGLCPQCGTNLNVASCLCESGSTHPAFSRIEKRKIEGE
ncbi:MAG: DUF177 domain-containing protein [Deltaproteobacteria bacterium]|nr:DUF177 domain-containing protein [Deltaproteobacteria bacterium]